MGVVEGRQVDAVALPVKDNKPSRWRKVGGPTTKAGRQEERLGWMLITPTVLVVVLVAIYPLFETFRLSFTNYRASRPDAWRYIGVENYRDLFADDVFLRSLRNTLVFTVTSVGLETLFGIIVALTIHSNFKGRGLVRTSMLVPWAIPTVVSSLLWVWMFHDGYGVINGVLVRLGFESFRNFNWVGDPTTALGAVVAVDVWKTTPFMALLLLAGLQVIPDDVYEASRVDGASKWQQFWQITLPLLRPALLVALIFRTMASFRVFDMIFVMKQYATDTMSVSIYAFREMMAQQKYGYGSAAAVVIFLCIALLVVGYTRLIRVEEG
jgi:trehalose/maltose transport system permease protein